jgi:hypothetical protein
VITTPSPNYFAPFLINDHKLVILESNNINCLNPDSTGIGCTSSIIKSIDMVLMPTCITKAILQVGMFQLAGTQAQATPESYNVDVYGRICFDDAT